MHQPFSYLSATINTYRTPFEIRPGQTATFRRAIAVYDGHATAADIQRLYDHWRKASAE